MKQLLSLLGVIALISTSCDATQKANDSGIHSSDELLDMDDHVCSAMPDVEKSYTDFREQDVVVTFDKNPEEVDGFQLSCYYKDATTNEPIVSTEYRGKDNVSGLKLPFEQDLVWCKVSHLDECTFIFHLSENNNEYIRKVILSYCLFREPIEVTQYPKGFTPHEEQKR